MTRAAPRPISTFADLEASLSERDALAREQGKRLGYAALVLGAGVIIAWMNGWYVSSASGPLGGAIAGIVCAAAFAGLALATVSAARRVGKQEDWLLQELRCLPRLSREAEPLRQGDRVGPFVVLEAGSESLHLARPASLLRLIFNRVLMIAAAGALAASFVFILGRYGPLLSRWFSTAHPWQNWKSIVALWSLPLFALALVVGALLGVPVQWRVSRETGSMQVERLRLLFRREVVEIPASDISSFSLVIHDLRVETPRTGYVLVSLPMLQWAREGLDKLADEAIGEVTHRRAERIAWSIARILDLPPAAGSVMDAGTARDLRHKALPRAA